jgi:hypothetical protein
MFTRRPFLGTLGAGLVGRPLALATRPPPDKRKRMAIVRASGSSVAAAAVTRHTRALQQICYLLYRPGCFRLNDRLAGRDLHPLEIADFHGVLV